MNQPPPMPVLQANLEDESQLRLLSVFHFVMGGLYTLGIGFIAFHYLMMRMIMTLPQSSPPAGVSATTGLSTPPSPPPAMPQEFMTVMIVIYILMGCFIVALATANVAAGFWLRKRVQRNLTYVVAAINCAFFPFGTVLGVFTLIVLSRATVRMSYSANTPA